MRKTILVATLLLGVWAQAQEVDFEAVNGDAVEFIEPSESGGVSPIRWWTCWVKDAPNVDYVGRAYGRKERAVREAFRQCQTLSKRPSTCRLLRCR